MKMILVVEADHIVNVIPSQMTEVVQEVVLLQEEVDLEVEAIPILTLLVPTVDQYLVQEVVREVIQETQIIVIVITIHEVVQMTVAVPILVMLVDRIIEM